MFRGFKLCKVRNSSQSLWYLYVPLLAASGKRSIPAKFWSATLCILRTERLRALKKNDKVSSVFFSLLPCLRFFSTHLRRTRPGNKSRVIERSYTSEVERSGTVLFQYYNRTSKTLQQAAVVSANASLWIHVLFRLVFDQRLTLHPIPISMQKYLGKVTLAENPSISRYLWTPFNQKVCLLHLPQNMFKLLKLFKSVQAAIIGFFLSASTA
jgi:hypothetical protein